MARNIWMRAVILNRPDVAQSLDATMPSWNTAAQGLKPEYFADLIKQHESAVTPEENSSPQFFSCSMSTPSALTWELPSPGVLRRLDRGMTTLTPAPRIKCHRHPLS